MSNTIVQITGSFEGWLRRKYGNDPENAKTLDSIDMAECWKLVAEKAKDDLANIDEIKKSIWGTNCKEFELKLKDALTKTKAAIEGKNFPTETVEETAEEINTIESEEITSEVTDEINEETEQIEDNTSIIENEIETESIEDTINEEIEEVEDIQIPTRDEENTEEVEEEINIPTHDEEESESTTVESTETEETENELDAYTKAFEAEVAALKNGENNTDEE